MCLILFAYHVHPSYPLILAANRDEYYQRPTRPLGFWSDDESILAGRDLEAKGTWLGFSRDGRWAALTNFRGSLVPLADAPSRGDLVRDYLAGVEPPEAYMGRVQTAGSRYNGFNLLVGDPGCLLYYSNQGPGVQSLRPGVHGLSTCLLGTQWPKIVKGKSGLAALVSKGSVMQKEGFFRLLEDRSLPAEEDIPLTGLDRNWERVLSPLFVESEDYGTRSSSVIFMAASGQVSFAERTFKNGRSARPAHETREFEFKIMDEPSVPPGGSRPISSSPS